MDLSFATKRRRRSAAQRKQAMPPDLTLLMADLSAHATASPTGLAQASLSRDEPSQDDKADPQAAILGQVDATQRPAGSFHAGVAGRLTEGRKK